MKSLRILSFLFFVALNDVPLSAQLFTVKLDSVAVDEKAKKMQSIMAVYHYTGQPFEDPVLNGIATKEQSNTFNAKLPDLKGVKDTSYAFIYFGGVPSNSKLKGYVLAIISNNTRNAKPCLIWLDKNFNLDLTDDGAPDTFYFNTKYLDFSFENPSVKGALYKTRISRFPFNYNPKYLSMLDDYYKDNSGRKQFSGAFYSFREERLNIKAGDYSVNNDSFRIALKDVNCNGKYNEPGIDVILIGDYKTPILTQPFIPISEKNGKSFFEKNGKHFDLVFIEENGNFIEVKHDNNARINQSLVIGKKLKKFKFKTTESEKKSVSIKKYKKKSAYIYVWRFGEKDFDGDTAALREIVSSYSDKINVITLNYGETPKEIRLFKNRNRINWLMGFSSTKINQQLFIEKYPTGILTKKKLRISRVGISPTELLNLLKNNSI